VKIFWVLHGGHRAGTARPPPRRGLEQSPARTDAV